MNIVALVGHLTRPVEFRELATGELVVSFDLNIRREDAPTESVPVVWHDPPAAAESLGPGATVVVVGRVRRRFFRTPGGTQSRTEVVADLVVPTRQRKRVEAALGAARERLAEPQPAPAAAS